MKNVINVKGLEKFFWKKKVLSEFNISIPNGCVYGLLGKNGAGKSTLGKILMGMIQEYTGDVNVLNMDPRKEYAIMRQYIGYVAEETSVYEWMTLERLIKFVSPFYRNWNNEYALSLAEKLDIPLNEKIKTFSRGIKRKTLLLLALAHNPDLVILDEPLAGIDPIVKHDFFDEMISLLSEEGKTVLFITNDPLQLERLADFIGIIDNGRLIISEPVSDLRTRFRRYELVLNDENKVTIDPDIFFSYKKNGREIIATVNDFNSEKHHKIISSSDYASYQIRDMSIEEIFINILKKGE